MQPICAAIPASNAAAVSRQSHPIDRENLCCMVFATTRTLSTITNLRSLSSPLSPPMSVSWKIYFKTCPMSLNLRRSFATHQFFFSIKGTLLLKKV
jgi:hypothetical protein